MHVWIDADGSPVVKQTLHVASRYHISVTIVTDRSHEIYDERAETIVVDEGRDAVDFEIIARMKAGDLVITQDYGLASLVLAKKGFAMNENGVMYREETIDVLLYQRAMHAHIRKSGGRMKGPKKRKTVQNEQFSKSFNQFLQSHDIRLK